MILVGCSLLYSFCVYWFVVNQSNCFFVLMIWHFSSRDFLWLTIPYGFYPSFYIVLLVAWISSIWTMLESCHIENQTISSYCISNIAYLDEISFQWVIYVKTWVSNFLLITSPVTYQIPYTPHTIDGTLSDKSLPSN